MYCTNCGKELTEGTNFCTACGIRVKVENAAAVLEPKSKSSALIGFSSKINDPSFEKYRKQSKSWSYLFSFILAAVAIVAFPIYSRMSGELEMPYSLYYGIGIGGMFILIAFFQSFRRNHDSTWDGVVIDKKCTRKKDVNDVGTRRSYLEYKLVIQRNNGKKYRHKWRNQPGLYNYYNIGDKVRHHKGFMYYEKYDKSGDGQIMCAACMAFNSIDEDFCVRCKRPLLK